MTQLRAKDDRIGRRFGVKEDSWGQGCLKKITRTGLQLMWTEELESLEG